MKFDNDTISLFSLLVSILSAIIAYKANINSRKANKIAQESMNFQIAPKNINFTKLELDPSKVKVFGGIGRRRFRRDCDMLCRRDDYEQYNKSGLQDESLP